MNRFLGQALRHCQTAAEIGCGFGVVLKQLGQRGIRAHGVDIHQPYLDYVHVVAPKATWERDDGLAWCKRQQPMSYDAVLMIDSIEHFDRHVGALLIAHAIRIARRAVCIATPEGYVAQEPEEAFIKGTPGVPDMLNPYERHVCGWTSMELTGLGFRCKVQPGNRGYDRLYAVWTR